MQVYKYAFLIIALSGIAFGQQDLGSSNGIFTNPKTKTAPKKAAPKPKAAAPTAKKTAPKAKPKTTTARATPKPAPAKPKSATPAKKNVVKKSAKPEVAVNEPPKPPTKSVVITVGDKSNEYDEVFEQAIGEGNAARDAREYTKAEAAYLRAQSLKIKDSRAIYGLGNLYSDQQRWEEAERAYRTAIELEPTAPEAHIALSYVLTQPIIGANLADRYSEAEQHARRAIELDQKNALAYDQLGVALELGGAISQETQNNYRKAIALEPTFALAYAHLGRLLRKNGLANDSAAAYRSAIQYSTDVATMVLVADVMQSQQKFAESEQLLRRALKDDDKNPTALYLLGRALTTRGSYDEAEKVLKKSAEVSPNSFVAYMLLGSMSMRREKFDDAEKYLTKAVSVVSLNEKKRLAQEFEAVGDGYLKVGKNKEAVRAFRQAAALDKDRATVVEKLARVQGN